MTVFLHLSCGAMGWSVWFLIVSFSSRTCFFSIINTVIDVMKPNIRIVALKAPRRHCTNKNELLHKIGCYNFMPCTYSYLEENFYSQFDGAVSITVVLKKSDNKVESSSPSKTFFLFFFYYFIFLFFCFAFANMQDFFVISMFAEKACFDVLCTCKRLHSVKWRSLYGDTATMQELLLKTCTSSAWRKRKLEGNCH